MDKFFQVLLVNLIQIYSFILILRSLLYFSKMPPSHHIAKFCIRVTQPVVRPGQAYFPCVFGFETVSLFIALLLAVVSSLLSVFYTLKLPLALQSVLAGLLIAPFLWIYWILCVYVGLIIVNIILRLFASGGDTAGFYIDKILFPFTRFFSFLKIGILDFSILPLFFISQFYFYPIFPWIQRAIIAYIGL